MLLKLQLTLECNTIFLSHNINNRLIEKAIFLACSKQWLLTELTFSEKCSLKLIHLMWRYNMSAVCEINPFQFNVTFDIETSHLICTANQMTGFHVKCDLGWNRLNISLSWNRSNHTFSKYAKFSEKLTFLTPWYAHVRIFVYVLHARSLNAL